MIKSLDPNDALHLADAVVGYANTASVRTEVEEERLFTPTHLVSPRLDTRNTPFVHAHSLLSAVDRVLSRPGIAPTSLDRLRIFKPIGRDLLVNAGDAPLKDRFPGAKPALEVLVSFEDGVQRVISAYDFGPEITQRNDPDALSYFSLFECDPRIVSQVKVKVDLAAHPGIFIGACTQGAIYTAFEETKANGDAIQFRSRPYVHSLSGFQLPPVDSFFEKGGMRVTSRMVGTRPLKQFPEGKLITSRVDFLQMGKIVGGGSVNMAYVPAPRI